MLEEHTPRPWRAFTNPSTGIFLLSGGDKSKNQCFPIIVANSAPTPKNACLLEAAPDMLEALIHAKSWLETWASAEKELDIINNAIAKAKGNVCGIVDCHGCPDCEGIK